MNLKKSLLILCFVLVLIFIMFISLVNNNQEEEKRESLSTTLKISSYPDNVSVRIYKIKSENPLQLDMSIQKQCVTECEIKKIIPGTYWVEAVKEGYTTYSGKKEIKAEEKNYFEISLIESSHPEANSEPENAD